jgi:hypothetical protein
MKTRQITTVILLAGLTLTMACKGKPKDAELLTTITETLKTIPAVTADVKEGVVTLSGEVASEAEKSSAETIAKAAAGVKSVMNNITVAAAPAVTAPQVTITADDALKTGVATVVKDYPGITANVKDGIITITGTQSAPKWKMLKMALDALNPKKVDASGLTIK